MNKLLSYKYYDTPEGQDVFMKTFVTCKYAGVAGLAGATADVLMYSHPKGFINTVGRMGYIIGPALGMAAAFTFTTNAAQNYRGKNDKINYFLGGVSSGLVFSAWMRNGLIAVPTALVLGAIAVAKKTGVDEGWTFIPELHQATKTIKSVKHDWSLAKDIEELKGWTDGSNKQ